MASTGIIRSMVRSAPDFFIIGAQKCGTTSLYNYLAKHPCVLAASEKEIHYFSDNYRNGYSWYRGHFPSLYIKYRRMLGQWSGVYTGEATPYYIFHPLAPKRISEKFSHAKFIVMLRNPVDRAYSHYRYHVKLGVENLTFEEAITAEPQRISGELDKMMADENYSGHNYKIYSYLKRGVYIEQIRRWREYFGRDQMLVIRSEDFFINPDKCFMDVQKFLGLKSYALPSYKKFNAGEEVPMHAGTREHLLAYFNPYNRDLYEYLQADYGWNN